MNLAEILTAALADLDKIVAEGVTAKSTATVSPVVDRIDLEAVTELMVARAILDPTGEGRVSADDLITMWDAIVPDDDEDED